MLASCLLIACYLFLEGVSEGLAGTYLGFYRPLSASEYSFAGLVNVWFNVILIPVFSMLVACYAVVKKR